MYIDYIGSKMKWIFSTSNHKILYLTMLVDCRKKISMKVTSKIIAIERQKEVFWMGFL
jgi:hypothetical protein